MCVIMPPRRSLFFNNKCEVHIWDTFSNSICLHKVWSTHLRFPFELHMLTLSAKCTFEIPFRSPHAYVKCEALSSRSLRKVWSVPLKYPFELLMFMWSVKFTFEMPLRSSNNKCWLETALAGTDGCWWKTPAHCVGDLSTEQNIYIDKS